MRQEWLGPVRLALVAVMSAAAPAVAWADGWRVPMQGTRALGMSYAGRGVLTSDASVTWFNPSAMTRLRQTRPWTITFAPPVITFDLNYRDAGSTSLLGQPLTGAPRANGGATAPVPHLYLVRRVNERVSVGLGVNAPFGLGVDYGTEYAGRYHATETVLRVFNINPSVAVAVSPTLSLGLGVDLQRAQTTIASAIDFGSGGAALGLGLAPQAHDGAIEFTGTNWAVGVDASLLWEPSARTRVGLVYRSQVTHTFDGTADFTVPAPAAPLTAGGLVFADGAARTSLVMPHDVAISLSQAVSDRWTLFGDVAWAGWDAFQTLEVTFDNPAQPPLVQTHAWRNTWRGALGAEYRAGDRWTLRAGTAYEEAPVPDATRVPRLPERDHVWISAGATRRFSEALTMDLSWSNLRTPTARLGLTDPAAGTLAANVRWRLHIISVAANVSF